MSAMRPRGSRLLLVLAVLAVGLSVAVAARAAPETPERRVERIVDELRCPVCQGLSVADSPSETARAMRELVAQRVAAGRTDDEIRAEFRASYGDWVFLSPRNDALGVAMWLLPIALIAGGAVIAWRRARAPADSGPTAGPAPSSVAALRARVAREEAADL